MGIFDWLKKKLTPKPDVLYVYGPSSTADEKLSRALKHLHDKAEKQRLLDTINRTQDILEDFESRIDADKADTSRSIRGIKPWIK